MARKKCLPCCCRFRDNKYCRPYVYVHMCLLLSADVDITLLIRRILQATGYPLLAHPDVGVQQGRQSTIVLTC